MKTFDDLVFRSWGEIHCIPAQIVLRLGRQEDKQATIEFENGYGISVLCGKSFYSNGSNTYEVAVMRDGKVVFPESVCPDGDVMGWRTAEEVTEIMRKVQEL